MKIKYFLTFVSLMIFSHGMFGSEGRGVKMGSPKSPLVSYLQNSASGPKNDLDNWFEITLALADHLKEFPKASIPNGKESLWASFAAQESISEDEDSGLRPLLSFQPTDNPEQAQRRHDNYMKVSSDRTEKLYGAYLAQRAQPR